MYKLFLFAVIIVLVISGHGLAKLDKRGASLKPLSACCDIPELGDEKHLATCSNPKPAGPCEDVKCIFEKHGFLTDQSTLNREKYTAHLRSWLHSHPGNWTAAIDKVVEDCVNKDIRQYLDKPCKAYDVFVCTSIAFVKKCPDEMWKC
uniref:Putative odorant binding protein 23 n=1 Tax=Conopomorpha sinensis TaxID=940481 RepID=A0A649ZUM0_9NEOP|nr:putative odorant binding protein 23 [Conopomorpha sinensis]